MQAKICKNQAISARAWATACMCALGFLAVCCSALDLSAYGLARYLNSDFLTPHFFCLDVLTGGAPLSGWTLSASPYFVPDHVLLGGLLTLFDHSGLAYGLFTLVFYPLLFVFMGLCLRTAVGRSRPAFLASLLFGNVFLALRFLPGHALYLWWLGAPCCHGGVLLLGFAYLWLLGSGLRSGNVGWLPAPLFGLSLVGLCSDSLFLLQILLPATSALVICRQWHSSLTPWLRWQGGCTVSALLIAQFFKPICFANDWFYFSRIIRVAPTPSHQRHALGQFIADMPHLLCDGWGFALFALAATVWLLCSSPVSKAVTAEPAPDITQVWVTKFYRVFFVASLCLMLPIPVLTCAWKSANNVRYLFNWLLLPGFILALAIAEKWEARVDLPETRPPWWPVGVTLVFLLCMGCAVDGLRGESLRFPYPDDVATLDTFLQSRGLRYGLAQYWRAKYVTALSHTGTELRQIRANGDPYFWDNNAFEYYRPNAEGHFVWPAYQYILMDMLDGQAVTKIYGEPQAKEHVGRFQVWLYSEEGQQRIRDALEPAVKQKLGPERLRRLR